MNFFETVKQSVTTRQAAERYGLSVNQSGMARCPFHEDHNPSMKVDDRFYCFGCGASGDVVDFTGRLFGISLKDAAKNLPRISASIPDHRHNRRFPTAMQSQPETGSGSAFVFSGNTFGIFVSGSCGIVLRSRKIPSIPALLRQ